MKPAEFSSKNVYQRIQPSGCISPDAVHSIGAAVFRTLYADQVGSRLHGGFGLVARQVYTRKAICDVGVPPGSRTWHIARIIKYSEGSGGNGK